MDEGAGIDPLWETMDAIALLYWAVVFHVKAFASRRPDHEANAMCAARFAIFLPFRITGALSRPINFDAVAVAGLAPSILHHIVGKK